MPRKNRKKKEWEFSEEPNPAGDTSQPREVKKAAYDFNADPEAQPEQPRKAKITYDFNADPVAKPDPEPAQQASEPVTEFDDEGPVDPPPDFTDETGGMPTAEQVDGIGTLLTQLLDEVRLLRTAIESLTEGE